MNSIYLEYLSGYFQIFLFFGGEYLIYTLFFWILFREGIEFSIMEKKYVISGKIINTITIGAVSFILIACNVIIYALM